MKIWFQTSMTMDIWDLHFGSNHKNCTPSESNVGQQNSSTMTNKSFPLVWGIVLFYRYESILLLHFFLYANLVCGYTFKWIPAGFGLWMEGDGRWQCFIFILQIWIHFVVTLVFLCCVYTGFSLWPVVACSRTYKYSWPNFTLIVLSLWDRLRKCDNPCFPFMPKTCHSGH